MQLIKKQLRFGITLYKDVKQSCKSSWNKKNMYLKKKKRNKKLEETR